MQESASRHHLSVSLAVLASLILLTGCVATDGYPIMSAESTSGQATSGFPSNQIRQADDNGKALPFVTDFANRWNANNSGTSYEPCTTPTDTSLRSFGLDPSSVKDAAWVDGQTVRGCAWRFSSSQQGELSQIVGVRESLDQFRSELAGPLNFRKDITVDGRRALVYSDDVSCNTRLISGTAAVTTAVVFPGGAATDPLCDKAIAFTRATAPSMPPPS